MKILANLLVVVIVLVALAFAAANPASRHVLEQGAQLVGQGVGVVVDLWHTATDSL